MNKTKKRKREKPEALSNAESCKRWRDLNQDRVQLYNVQRQVKKLKLEKDDPKGAEERRAHLAKQRREQRQRKKEKETPVSSAVFRQEEADPETSEEKENQEPRCSSQSLGTIKTKFNFRTPKRQRDYEEKDDSESDEELPLVNDEKCVKSKKRTPSNGVEISEMKERPRNEFLVTKKKINNKENTDEMSDNEIGLGKVSKQTEKLKLSRQAQVGLKIRRTNMINKEKEFQEKCIEIKEVKLKNKELIKSLQAAEIKNLEQEKCIRELKLENSKMKANKEKDEIWIKTTFKNMPKSGRQIFKDSLLTSRDNLPAGTFLKVRKLLGVNLHQMPTIEEKDESELAVLVQEFAELNSDPVPYTKTCSSVAGVPDKRFALHFKNVLHETFNAEYPDKPCSYSAFCKYWPSHVVKPNLDSRGTCKCELCENSLMIQQALKTYKLIDQADDVFMYLKSSRQGDDDQLEELFSRMKNVSDGEHKDKVVTYKRWENIQTVDPVGKKRNSAERRTRYVKVKNLVNQALEDFNSLKAHLKRNAELKQYISEKREHVKECDDQAMLYIDWSECGTFKQPGETQGAWFSKKQYSILSGYQYSKMDSHGFAALSMYTNHMAECHFVALQPKLTELSDQGVKKVIFVSDSPISEFRNMKNVWLISEWAKQYQIEVEWIFTEKSHGKSVADGIGGGIKSKHEDLVSFNTNLTINNVDDLARVLAPQTSIKISVFTKEKVDEFRQWLPSKLNSLTGAFKIHHLTFTTDGKVMSRELPQDAVGARVNIRAGFGAVANRTATPTVTIHPEAEEEEAELLEQNSVEE